jgi:hypothetical protein
MANENNWCFAWLEQGTAAGADRAALLRGAKWNVDQEITVSFLDDDHGLRNRIKDYALQWTDDGVKGMAHVKFSFRKDTTDTLIRISFRQKGNWSAIGTTCRKVTDKAKPTMNFGNLNSDSTEEQIRRAVLHEFGHALGLIHEHQSPAAGIRWNEVAVYRDLMPPRGNWSKKIVDDNLFKTYTEQETNFTEMDETSIMVYPIPAHWTENGISFDWNTDLSARDIDFIKKEYGKPAPDVN